MTINFNDLLYAFSYGLDCVEYELVGAQTNHSKRVAYISTLMGSHMGIAGEDLLDLAACAVLHDCALTEYLKVEQGEHRKDAGNKDIGLHCTMGERNIKNLPFFHDVSGAVLYHHENPDGSGPFGRKTEDTPLYAQLIHFADLLDVNCSLGVNGSDKYEEVSQYLKQNEGALFEPDQVKLFLSLFGPDMLADMEGSGIDRLLKKDIPQRRMLHAEPALHASADFFAKIIDYKSEFTNRHSLGFAQKAEAMARYYGYSEEMAEKLYFTGAVHDIGKLAVSKDILEKPDKLSESEYLHIQTHAYATYKILSGIEGMEDITRWASNHHEKLDGSGYPFGRKAEELGKIDRLMACLDIYQALTEPRPYKEGMPHDKVIGILIGMSDKNLLDRDIINDIDRVFGSACDTGQEVVSWN